MSKTSTFSRPRKPTSNRKSGATGPRAAVTNDEPGSEPSNDTVRRAMIAEAAYYRAERRGFAPGLELEDWLLSESELVTRAFAQAEQQRLRPTTSTSSELH